MKSTALKAPLKTSILNLSVEEENLATIPFAVLERRVGKKVSKLEIKGSKMLPDGRELSVNWQVQGNSELGLPTEQDLDIFVALGVITFRSNFAKTITFSGREIARILNISSVHGKFYTRLKVAMDRFIPLRFRAIAETDRQEEVKWVNVFQEASFSLDRDTGRCTGSVTWTDKLIQSMDSGFFRALDAERYMELDGITAKHLYRFLVPAFEKSDTILIDTRTLSTQHLGVVNLPRYFSRLMQTLEPAFDQLRRIEVLGDWHIVSNEDWKVALRRHPNYVPERKTLLLQSGMGSIELSRQVCSDLLETAGFSAQAVEQFCSGAYSRLDFYALERAGRLAAAMREAGVLPHVALSMIRKALEAGFSSEDCREQLDWIEIAVEVCAHKQRQGQVMKNAAGLLMKIAKDAEGRSRLVSHDHEQSSKRRFREREQGALRQEEQAEERSLICEYENFRRELSQRIFADMPEANQQALRKEKLDLLGRDGRLQRLSAEARDSEIEDIILQDIARKEAPTFEKWRFRRSVQQAVLPFNEMSNFA